MKNLITILFLLAISGGSLQAQNINVSQFDNNPLSVNPGMTGDIDGRLRANAYYRNQWTNLLDDANIQTYTFSVDYRLPLGENLDLGIGLAGLSEIGGSLNYTVKTYQVSSALHYYLGDRLGSHHKFSFGLSGGPASKDIDLEGAVWSSEHDGNGGVDPNLGPPLPQLDPSFVYPLLSSGLIWSYQSSSRFAARAGIAAYGFNQAPSSFDPDSDASEHVFWTAIGQVELPIGNRFSVTPSAYYVKNGSMDQLTFGTFGRFYTSAESNQRYVQLGVFGKTAKNPDLEVFFNQVFSVQGRLQWDWVSIGYAFDRHNLSGVFPGYTHEFTLGYLLGNGK